MAKTSCKICITAILLLSFAIGVNAQSLDSNRTYIPKFAVKYSPFHLLYKYPSMQLAVEHKVCRNLTMQYDAGIVFSYPGNSNNNEDYANKRGYRLIAELRYYLPFTPRVPFYLAAEGYYHNIVFDRRAVVGYINDNGTYSYYEYITHAVRTRQSGGGLKLGMLIYPGRWSKNSRFFLDINGGLAIRGITYTNERLPPGRYTFFENKTHGLFDPDEKNHTETRPIIGIRLGYRIK